MLNAKAKKEAKKNFCDVESKLLDSFSACIKLQETFNNSRERASNQISLSLQIINSISVTPKEIDTIIRQTTISLDNYKSCIENYKPVAITLPKDSFPQHTTVYNDNYYDDHDDDSESGLGSALIGGGVFLLLVGGLLAYEANKENKRLSQEYTEQAKRYEKALGLIQGLKIMAEDKVKELENEISHLSDICSQAMSFRGAMFKNLSESDQDMLIFLARETGVVATLLTFDLKNQIDVTLEALKKLEMKSEDAIKGKAPSARQNDAKRIDKGHAEDDIFYAKFPDVDNINFPDIDDIDFPDVDNINFPNIDDIDFPDVDDLL